MTTLNSQIDYNELARQIAVLLSPEALLTAEDIGVMLNYPARYIRETISLAPGFPEAIRLGLPSTKDDKDGKVDRSRKRGNRRWRRSDIENWIEAHASGRRPGGGRRRNVV